MSGSRSRYHPADFMRGLVYPLSGLAFLRRHPGLKRLWLPPIVLTFLALCASVVVAVRYHDDVIELLWAAPSGEGIGVGLMQLAHFLLRMLSLLVGIGLSMVACIAIANLIAAPFNDALSEAVERIETGQPGLPFSFRRLLSDLGRTLRVELVKLTIYAGVMGPALVASWLLPGIGQLLYTVFGLLFTSLYMALDYVDWPASRRGYALRERLALLRVRPLLTLGFGFAVAACLFVPLLNLFFMPLAVAGGTRLFLDLLTYRERDV